MNAALRAVRQALLVAEANARNPEPYPGFRKEVDQTIEELRAGEIRLAEPERKGRWK